MRCKTQGILKAKRPVIYITPKTSRFSMVFQKKKGLLLTIGRKSLKFTYKIKKTPFFGHFSNKSLCATSNFRF